MSVNPIRLQIYDCAQLLIPVCCRGCIFVDIKWRFFQKGRSVSCIHHTVLPHIFSLPQLQPLVTISPELRLLPFLLPCSSKSQPLLPAASSHCPRVYRFLWCKSAKDFYCQKSHITRLPHLVNLQPLDIQHRHGTEYILLMMSFQYRAESGWIVQHCMEQ